MIQGSGRLLFNRPMKYAGNLLYTYTGDLSCRCNHHSGLNREGSHKLNKAAGGRCCEVPVPSQTEQLTLLDLTNLRHF